MTRARLSPVLRRRARRARAGFTLVELMVAMTGGLFLSIVVFALSRDATQFYQRESRLANATLAGVNGFDRLAADVARAGHMSSPNIKADPRVCNRPEDGWPDAIENLRAVVIDTSGDSVSGTEVEAAGITPHSIQLSGAFDTTEELYTNSIEIVSGGFSVSLNRDTPAARRLGLSPLPADEAQNAEVLASRFMAGSSGRIVRLRKDGKEQYGLVASVSADANTATLTLADEPALRFRQKDGVQCGIDGTGKDYGVSIINIVRYELRSMKDSVPYKALFDAAGRNAPFEDKRVELVRVELDADGQPIESTREIIAEYAVDLHFSAWSATSSTVATVIPVSADSFTSLTGSPQLLRGLNVRLSVRSREADRMAGVTGDSPLLHRIPLGPPVKYPDMQPHARVRTFQSDIPMRNLENHRWPG